MSGGAANALRILLAGDVCGHLNLLFKRVLSVNKTNGPFDFLLCVGQFFPVDASGIEEVETYITGAKTIPIPTYFIGEYGEWAAALLSPARLEAASAGMPSMDGIPVCHNLFWLKGGGVFNLKGLRVAYLSGKHNAELYCDAKRAADAGAHHEDDIDTLRAFADDPSVTDLFLSNEWPQGILTGADLAGAPQEINREATGSTIAAELASELKPRYHFAGSEGVFYAREPYSNPRVVHTTRFIGLAAVGNGKKQKFIHALSLTPASAMQSLDLATRPPNTTMSPYEIRTRMGNQKTPVLPGAALKRGLAQSGKDTTDSPEGQYWRYDVSQGKRQRRDDGGDRVCFEFVKQGSCARGENCRFKHDFGNGTPIPKGACFDFVTKGECERGADCRYRHSLDKEQEDGGGEALPPGVCFDFFRKGKCERGTDCRFSHSLDSPRPIRPPRAPPEACWFCLSSPNIDTHLVVSVGDHCYCAVAKGPLVPGHVLILPIEHYPSMVSLPPDAETELQKYKESLRSCFKSQGKATVIFERYLQLRAGTHAHLQVVPIPPAKASSAESAFVAAAKEVGFEFQVIHPGDVNSEGRPVVKELIGGGENYFFVELPEGTILAHQLAQGQKLPMQLGREVVAALLEMPERWDWKVCKLDKEEESSMADQFKEQFRTFDPML